MGSLFPFVTVRLVEAGNQAYRRPEQRVFRTHVLPAPIHTINLHNRKRSPRQYDCAGQSTESWYDTDTQTDERNKFHCNRRH